ncbi:MULTISPECIES: DEAD/DEAH box helicase [unclassified Rhizobacter]|uniref:DEAD/DEAH box helicase n=1 Tax=unclassified Rhizobacter TaxID=2640088 RepID=UPI0006FD8659|nr:MULTISPECIES: DEAD/DEAH box helicase [unclassified Rhizobacter]KQU71226.1 RNA helicase [Rhizobacter sp. Root29]KQV97089.1 RNA helicase [Rhizobacter sp. Root1238]KRB24161.1 RNA helicase [Rhizobacter sp. Root16D2]
MSSENNFEALGLHAALLQAVKDSGYDTPTDVQARAIPPAIEGKDLMVASSTGSGKTASFVLPGLQRILAARGDNNKRREKGMVYGPRILVLAPTRELAMQVDKAATVYGKHVQGLRVTTVVGGVPYGAQLKALRGPLDILIATPGRLLDHLNSGKAILENVEMLVLDEADRMLDMGFIDDIRTIADQLPEARQTVMYSATFAGHVGRLAQDLLRDPQRIEVTSHTDTHENIEQRLHWADNGAHKNALLDHILTEREMEQAVVFTSTQRDADWLADRLADMGHAVASLHGGMPQGRRTRVLQGLRNKELRVLVATDVAARGIDVPTISHVINYGLPMKAEDYVHRIGRTGRAGRNGLAVTLAERMDTGMIRRIQAFTTQNIPVKTIVGLEPKSPEPRMFAARPEGKFGGKPFGHGRGGHGGHQGGKSFGRPAPRGEGFAPRNEGFAPRGEGFSTRGPDGFAPRGSFDRPAPERRDNPFANRPPHEGAPRHAFDRAPADRGNNAGFAPRKPGGPGANKGGFGKPQRPRQGGFSR